MRWFQTWSSPDPIVVRVVEAGNKADAVGLGGGEVPEAPRRLHGLAAAAFGFLPREKRERRRGRRSEKGRNEKKRMTRRRNGRPGLVDEGDALVVEVAGGNEADGGHEGAVEEKLGKAPLLLEREEAGAPRVRGPHLGGDEGMAIEHCSQGGSRGGGG